MTKYAFTTLPADVPGSGPQSSSSPPPHNKPTSNSTPTSESKSTFTSTTTTTETPPPPPRSKSSPKTDHTSKPHVRAGRPLPGNKACHRHKETVTGARPQECMACLFLYREWEIAVQRAWNGCVCGRCFCEGCAHGVAGHAGGGACFCGVDEVEGGGGGGGEEVKEDGEKRRRRWGIRKWIGRLVRRGR